MKRIFAIAFLGLILSATIAACGTHKNCEAYGGDNPTIEQIDLERPS
jgi:hypothetical protein